ncbi:helix-turn-helix domain-containing protein [Ramlibacter solisilvae]|uniref:helix-turn-helix domain-containing protein n=1 Tax=Ramlibacter tataouinensis TaxID=94132 RepID=UPI00077735F4|nr:helix-turn-helix domain-containing protein [Ramlibacter tataouinensis]
MDAYYSVRHYSDPQDHAQSLLNFDQEYVQVEKGPFRSALMQAELGGLCVYAESVDRGIVERTHLEAGCVALGWRMRAGATPGFANRQIAPSSGGLLRGGQDWMLDLQPGTEMCGITMPADEFDRLAEPLGVSVLHQRHALIRPSDRALATMQWCLSQIEHQAPRMANADVRASLRDHLLESVFQAFCEAEPPRRPDVTRLAYHQVVKRSQELALASPDRPPSVLELCAELRVSRRTLQNSFVHVIGQPPSSYLRCLRLGRVRRLLRTSPAEALSVGDAAARWGFFHLGHFANDYRRLFGELPSQTARLPGEH